MPSLALKLGLGSWRGPRAGVSAPAVPPPPRRSHGTAAQGGGAGAGTVDNPASPLNVPTAQSPPRHRNPLGADDRGSVPCRIAPVAVGQDCAAAQVAMQASRHYPTLHQIKRSDPASAHRGRHRQGTDLARRRPLSSAAHRRCQAAFGGSTTRRHGGRHQPGRKAGSTPASSTCPSRAFRRPRTPSAPALNRNDITTTTEEEIDVGGRDINITTADGSRTRAVPEPLLLHSCCPPSRWLRQRSRRLEAGSSAVAASGTPRQPDQRPTRGFPRFLE